MAKRKPVKKQKRVKQNGPTAEQLRDAEEIKEVMRQVGQQNDIHHWLGVIKPKAIALLKGFKSNVFAGWDKARKRAVIEERDASEHPFQLPDEKPEAAKSIDWKRAQYARKVMWEILCLEDQIARNEPRGIAIHALRVGALTQAIELASYTEHSTNSRAGAEKASKTRSELSQKNQKLSNQIFEDILKQNQNQTQASIAMSVLEALPDAFKKMYPDDDPPNPVSPRRIIEWYRDSQK